MQNVFIHFTATYSEAYPMNNKNIKKTSGYKTIITGATGGIGREIVKKLASQCEYIILVGLLADELSTLIEELKLNNAHVIEGNIGQLETRNRIKNLAKSLGGVNLLINNAGTNNFNLFENQTAETIGNIMDVNLIAPMLLTSDMISILKKEPQAQIINTGSIFGYIGYPGFSAYSASKFGLRGFSQALNRELGDTNIKVRYFAPRATQTKFNNDKVVEMNQALNTSMDTPAEVATHFMKFLNQSSNEMKIGFKESFFVWMNNFLPSIPDKSIIKQLPIIKQYLPKQKGQSK